METSELLVALGQIMDEKLEPLRVDMAQLRTDVSAEISHLRADVAADSEKLRADVSAEIGQLRADVASDIGKLRTEAAADSRQTRILVESQGHNISLIAEQYTDIATKLGRVGELDLLRDRVGTLETVVRNHSAALKKLCHAQ